MPLHAPKLWRLTTRQPLCPGSSSKHAQSWNRRQETWHPDDRCRPSQCSSSPAEDLDRDWLHCLIRGRFELSGVALELISRRSVRPDSSHAVHLHVERLSTIRHEAKLVMRTAKSRDVHAAREEIDGRGGKQLQPIGAELAFQRGIVMREARSARSYWMCSALRPHRGLATRHLEPITAERCRCSAAGGASFEKRPG